MIGLYSIARFIENHHGVVVKSHGLKSGELAEGWYIRDSMDKRAEFVLS